MYLHNTLCRSFKLLRYHMNGETKKQLTLQAAVGSQHIGQVYTKYWWVIYLFLRSNWKPVPDSFPAWIRYFCWHWGWNRSNSCNCWQWRRRLSWQNILHHPRGPLQYTRVCVHWISHVPWKVLEAPKLYCETSRQRWWWPVQKGLLLENLKG